MQSAAMSRMTPFSYRSYSTAPIAVDGYEAPPDEQPTVDYNEVGPAYFATMGIPHGGGPRVHAPPTTKRARRSRSSMKPWRPNSGAGAIRSAAAFR